MEPVRELVRDVFAELNSRISVMNQDRKSEGLLPISRARVRLLGQMSLLVSKASARLSLAQTGDMDALLVMEHAVKEALKDLLRGKGLVYDDDSHLIWLPPDTKFEVLFEFENVRVEVIDPESALVSKAVKAPEKNRQLIRQAIASDEFPRLVDRILENGGRLEDFA